MSHKSWLFVSDKRSYFFLFLFFQSSLQAVSDILKWTQETLTPNKKIGKKKELDIQPKVAHMQKEEKEDN